MSSGETRLQSSNVPTIPTVWNLRDVSSRMPVQGALKCQEYRGLVHFKLGWLWGMASYDLAALFKVFVSARFGFADDANEVAHAFSEFRGLGPCVVWHAVAKNTFGCEESSQNPT